MPCSARQIRRSASLQPTSASPQQRGAGPLSLCPAAVAMSPDILLPVTASRSPGTITTTHGLGGQPLPVPFDLDLQLVHDAHDPQDSDYEAAEVIDIPLHRVVPSFSASSSSRSFSSSSSSSSSSFFIPRRPRLQENRADSPTKPMEPSLSQPKRPVVHLQMHIPERSSSKYPPDHTVGNPELGMDSSSPSTAYDSQSRSQLTSLSSYETNASSLPPLQQNGALDEQDQLKLQPLDDENIDPGSFDLVAQPESESKQYSLETRSEQLFSTEHLKIIFADPSLLLRFTAFLSGNRLSSIPILIYYLDAIKALQAIDYANAIAQALEPISGLDFTSNTASRAVNTSLEEKAKQAFDVMVREDLPAYITHTYIQTVSLSIQRRITGTLPINLREASEGLAEVFCLTDPSRPDNPIVFASEEFHRTTQYGMNYVLGRNCRFLQGPKTNPFSTKRIKQKIDAGHEHCEVFLNYRRDGSPFMNLLMIAPLCDSRGTVRYFIGAQVDVSGLVKDCSDLESLKRLVAEVETPPQETEEADDKERDRVSPVKEEFEALSEMLNLQELDTVRRCGGRMHKESKEDMGDSSHKSANWQKPRLLINSMSPDGSITNRNPIRISGRLHGIYENYLLVRPYPSLRILFASASLRVPGILQSPFLDRIGGSPRVREELTQALADGRGVTAKVVWVSKKNGSGGRNRWIHCTPLLGVNGAVGVWMIVIVDGDDEPAARIPRFRQAPPVDPNFGRSTVASDYKDNEGSLSDFAIANGGVDMNGGMRNGGERNREGSIRSGKSGTERCASVFTLSMD